MTASNEDGGEFVRLLSRHQLAIEGYVFSLVVHRADAEDLMQEVSLALWSKFEHYDASRSFFRWACGVAYVEVLRYRRRSGRDRLWFFDEQVLDQLSEGFLARSDELEIRRDALKACFDKLPETDKSTIQQRYMRGWSVAELARRSSTPESTIYKRLTRIRRTLHRCVKATLAQQGVKT